MNLLPEFHVKTKLPSLDRLEKTASDLVFVHAPMIVSQTDNDMPEMIKEVARDTYQVQVTAPAPVSAILFKGVNVEKRRFLKSE